MGDFGFLVDVVVLGVEVFQAAENRTTTVSGKNKRWAAASATPWDSTPEIELNPS